MRLNLLLYLFLIFQLFLTFACCKLQSDYVKVKSATSTSPSLNLTFTIQHQYNTTGYCALVGNPIKHFHIYFPESSKNTCNGWSKTNETAEKHGCIFATNGSPFSFSKPSCLGYLVSDSVLIDNQNADSPEDYYFGLTQDGYFVFGSLTLQDILDLKFDQLMFSFGWLVRAGKIVPDSVRNELEFDHQN